VYGVRDSGLTSSDPNSGQSAVDDDDQPPALDVDDDGEHGDSSISPQLLKLLLRDQTDAAIGDSGTTCGSISLATVQHAVPDRHNDNTLSHTNAKLTSQTD